MSKGNKIYSSPDDCICDVFGIKLHEFQKQFVDRNDVVDVNVLVPNKVVEVLFGDGTKEKSVCYEPDVFSLDTAISICISKHLMGGSSKFNNTVRKAVKLYEKKIVDAEKAEKEKIAQKAREQKVIEKRRRRAARAREREIEIQKEAYLRAMREAGTIG